jgi:hypothetical protein
MYFMLEWFVIDRQHLSRASREPRQTTPKSSSLSLCVRFSRSFPLTPVVSTGYGHTSATAAPQPLCNQFVTHTIQRDGGCTPLPACQIFPWRFLPYFRFCLRELCALGGLCVNSVSFFQRSTLNLEPHSIYAVPPILLRPVISGNFLSPTLVPISMNRPRAGQEASSHVRP